MKSKSVLIAAIAVAFMAVSCTPTTTPASTTTSEVAASTTSTSALATTTALDHVFFSDLADISSGQNEVFYSETFDSGAFGNIALQSVASLEFPSCGDAPCINTNLVVTLEFSVDGTRWYDLGVITLRHEQKQLAKAATSRVYSRYVRARVNLIAQNEYSQGVQYVYPGTLFVAARFTI